jgi:NADH-quinone oxidoreductase subunit C
MHAQAIFDLLRQAAPDAGLEIGTATDEPTVYVARGALVAVARALRDTPGLRFHLLADVTAVDWYPREPRFEVVYHLASIGIDETTLKGRTTTPFPETTLKGRSTVPQRLRLKVRLPGDDARVPSIADVWPAAEWAEREVFDLFGIVFDGHRDLRRILMPEDWEGHPLRKDYPVQIRMAVKTYEPLQLSPEQFAANVRAARSVESGLSRTLQNDDRGE